MSVAGPSSLPNYSASAAPPCYSSDPSQDEELLEYSYHSRRSRAPPSGTYTHQSRGAVVVFSEQEDNVTLPSFDGLRPISGVLSVDSREKITEILLIVEGYLDVHVSTGPGSLHPQSVVLVDEQRTLWSRETACVHAPSSIPFSVALPSTFTRGDHQHPLPPSHNFKFTDASGFVSECKYSLRIVITKTRSGSLFLPSTKTQRIKIPFKYSPRKRPHLPILSDPSFFSTLKSSPEEWHETQTPLIVRFKRDFSPIDCHFLIPSSQVFSLSDKIPFHLQLTGAVKSLCELLSISDGECDRSRLSRCLSGSSSSSTSSQPSSPKEPRITVRLQRYITANHRGSTATRIVDIGEGTLHSVPPSFDNLEDNSVSSLDWVGEIHCDHEKDESLGSFTAGSITVRHSITFWILPHNPNKSTFMPIHKAVPIHLVTDPWSDMFSSDGRLGLA